jgi:hypothetical protein
LLRKYNNYIKDLEKKLKEKEIEKKPEAIEEMKKLLEEKDLKIQELKQQLVVSSSNESFVAQTEDIVSLTFPFHEKSTATFYSIGIQACTTSYDMGWRCVEIFP